MLAEANRGRLEVRKREAIRQRRSYPADKQTDVPLDYGAEFPNPIPNRGTGGYAITLQFPPFDKVTGATARYRLCVTAKLTDGKSNPVQFFLSDPEGSRGAVWRFFRRHNISFKKNSVRGGAEARGRGPRPAALDARTGHV